MTSPSRKPFYKRKRWVAAAVLWLVVVPPAAFFALIIWNENRPAIPASHAARLHLGMTDAEVRSLIGRPQRIYPRRGGGQQWVFHKGTISRHYVEFAENGQLVSHWEDR